ncbi:MAG: hypothetical protein EOP06_04435 [Proteobacteria bacterium]|nr:MAG: hypothetical protein EOP06_04435 [Pseudomonadota bacterium]
MNAQKRYLESIRNSKLDLGFAVYAFPESSATETAKDSESADKPLYVATAAKLIGDYAPKLSATEIDYFGIDTAGEISSARKFRLLSTKAALDVSALNSSVKQVWVHADAFFASLKMTGTLEGATAKNLATLDQLQAASDAIEQDAVHLKQFIGNVRDTGNASLHALQTILRSTTDADERSQLETEIAELRTTLAKLATMQEESRTLFSASLSGIGKIISDSQRQLLDAIQ